MNKIILGDCLNILNTLQPKSIDLIYLDPPFFTERIHKLKNNDKEYSFEDIFECEDNYRVFLFDRLLLMKELLKETGSIFVHCDKTAEHIIRGLLNEIFGESNFQSEIIWHYKRWSNSRKGLLPSHQNIYFYSKSKNFKFNTIYTPYSETTNIDQLLYNRTKDANDKSVYQTNVNGEYELAKEKKGVPLSDVWDIPFLNPKAKERVGYPTQKPISLLQRIIELVTDEGDLVLDPFCGSGTTCVSAKLLNRKYIGIDKSKDAIDLTKSRLEAPVMSESKVLKNGRNSFKKDNETLLKNVIEVPFIQVQRNKGIDAILVEHYKDAPVLVKIQNENESLESTLDLLEKAVKTKKSKKAFLIQTKEGEIHNKSKEVIIIKSPKLQIKENLKL